MAQYRHIKNRYGDCILLFRVGDFYETFYEDAVDVSSILNITLTTRDKNKPNPIPLAGVPFHAADTYIPRLLAAGRKIAVCEQVEDPALAKGLVRRDVVEVLTPGTSLGPQVLADVENNYCLCVHPSGEGRMALAWIDVGTGECVCGEADETAFFHLVQGKRIRELVYARSTTTPLANLLTNT
jgi:DNA mismatch repair protein MutS